MTTLRVLTGTGLQGVGLDTLGTVGSGQDWSDDNPPWAFSSTSEITRHWPAGLTETDLVNSGTGNLRIDLEETLAPFNTGRRVVVRMPLGIRRFKSFEKIGSGNNPTYAFGFWNPKLQGFLGVGPTGSIIQMDPNSMTSEQLSYMSTMDPATFAPLQMGLIRLDGSTSSPVLIGGVTFRAADQQNLTAKHSGLSIAVPQPAPHQGVVIYSGSDSIVSHSRFQAAGRAASSAPPFEMGNLNTQYGTHLWHNTEIDGRRAPELNPAKPKRCGVIMGNNENALTMRDVWLHDSNVSRYAVNDQNRETRGVYRVERVKSERITTNMNVDPALNGGASLGGWTNASNFGWESCNGEIRVEDTIVSVDNPNPLSGSGQIPCHFQMTSVGSRNPQGGRMYVSGTAFHHLHAQLDGFATFRISPSTFWWSDGFNNTIFVYHHNTGERLYPHVVTGTWPPTAASLASAGVTPQTRYLIRST